MFPTKIAVSLAKASDIHKLFEGPHGYEEPLGQFQRLSLVTDFDIAFKALNPHLIDKPNEQQLMGLRLIGDMVKHDTLSIAVEKLVHVVENTRVDKDRIAAATILNELYGDKKITNEQNLGDRLIMNLVGNS